jgi:hypothetical protein
MNLRTLSLLTLAATASLGLGACAVMPSGPTVMALPGSNKTFDQFRGDDYNCRQFAFQQIGGTTAQQNANAAAVGSTVVGTALGAAAGAAFGGGSGAAVGAGAGMLTARPLALVPPITPPTAHSASTTPHTSSACTQPAIAYRCTGRWCPHRRPGPCTSRCLRPTTSLTIRRLRRLATFAEYCRRERASTAPGA